MALCGRRTILISEQSVRSFESSSTYLGFPDLTFDTDDLSLSSLDSWHRTTRGLTQFWVRTFLYGLVRLREEVVTFGSKGFINVMGRLSDMVVYWYD